MINDAYKSAVKFQRKAKSMTQQQLADASGVCISQIRKVERGEIDPSNMTAKNLLAIADALSVDPHDLI